MSSEGIDEWDENFLDEAIRIELEALSSRNTPLPTPPPSTACRDGPAPWPRPVSDPLLPFPSSVQPRLSRDAGLGFSPPRELSQRFPERPNFDSECEIVEPWASSIGPAGSRNDKEVDRLKRELSRISKQINQMERECVELKKDRAKKDEQLRCAFSHIEAKNKEIHRLKSVNVDASKEGVHSGEAFVNWPAHFCAKEKRLARDSRQMSGRMANGASVKFKVAIHPSQEYQCPKQKDDHTNGMPGVLELKHRTMSDDSLPNTGDRYLEENSFVEKNDAESRTSKAVGIQTDLSRDKKLSTENISSKLAATIWGIPNRAEQDLISMLIASCSEDFFSLFRFMRSPKVDANSSTEVDANSSTDTCSSNTALHEAISQFYAVSVKMHRGAAQMRTLFEALFNLCTVENVFVVGKSLRILHMVLRNFLTCEVTGNRRINVLVENAGESNQSVDLNNLETWNELTPSVSVRFSDHGDSFTSNKWHADSTHFPLTFWISIFETMQKVAMKNYKENVCGEALSIMILIVMRTNPITERDKFELMPVIGSLHQLLQRKAGLAIRKQAVFLLFLLLNCPKLLTLFCNGDKDGNVDQEIVEGQKDVLQGATGLILEDLSECFACDGSTRLEVKLCREAIILLAYIASNGKSGYRVLLCPVSPQRISFLELIIQVLASEMDADITGSTEAQALCKEWNLLVREALILLNRLASHMDYSKTTLDVLTSSKSCASLTIDVANRMPRKGKGWWNDTGAKNTQLETEIADLARVFRNRVFAFLGERHPDCLRN